MYEQDDESFYTGVTTSKDEKYVLIAAQSTVSTEWRYARADDPALAFKVFLPRERDHEYQVEHLDGRWIIRTNWQAPNFRLMEAKVGEEGDRAHWHEIVPTRDDAFIHGFDVFRDFLAIEERSDAMRKIRIRPWGGGKDFYIASDEPAYATGLGQNAEIDTNIVRYEYTSLTTPTTVYDYDIRTGERQLMKRTPVLGGYDPANYGPSSCGRLRATARRCRCRSSTAWASGRTAARRCCSMATARTARRMTPRFPWRACRCSTAASSSRIAHIRGGQEMGRRWYDDGRLLNKKNTFTDFIDVTRHLVKEGYADGKRVFGDGRQRRRAAHGRGRQHGARRLPRASSRRCRSSTSSRRCSTRASR